MLRDRLARWRETLERHLVGRVTVTREIRGFPVTVVNTRPDIDTARVIERLDATLALVERYVPWRFRRLRHDLAGILVRRFPCRAAYFPDTRLCLLELTFLVNPSFSVSQLASSLVHEGMHARLHRAGVRPLPGREAKEERACRRAEIELGLAVPDGAPVVERARAALALGDEGVAPAIDWAEASRRVHEADARSLVTPRWLRSTVDRPQGGGGSDTQE